MKARLFHLFCAASYWCGLDAVFYWLNRKAKRVLCFHHVLPDGMALNLPLDAFAITESQFRRVIGEVRRRFRFSLDIDDSSTVTITFDDGFLDQYEIAADVLREEGNVPAYLFAAGQMIDNDNPETALDCDLLAAWATFAPEGNYQFRCNGAEQSFAITGETGSRRKAWLSALRPVWVEELSSGGRRGALLEALRKLYPFDKIFAGLPERYARLRMTGISRSQLEDLSARGWKIGWHTYSHCPLKALPLPQREKELAAPPEFAKEAMAYPFGGPDAIDEETIAITSRKGYPCAFSYRTDPGPMMGRWFLPRMSLSVSKYELHCELSGLKHFLKTRRLLPKFSLGNF